MKTLFNTGNYFTLLFLIILFFNTANSQAQPAAFPGAEGYGSTTIGGRGGKVIEVTNLNAYGPGSLKAACEASGPRIVIFKTGGTIELRKNIKIKKPFITIAGQSAPGDGICIKGAGIHISTHDVIIRGLRIRVGDMRDGPKPLNRDGISLSNPRDPVYNIIIDHCSISWAVDENLALFKNCSNITIQWCILSEGLQNSIHPEGQHSCGMKIGPDAKNISIHHNLFAHNYRRNPKLARNHTTTAEVINNVVYNWRSRGTDILANVNAIGNFYKSGPDWNKKHKGIHVKGVPGTKAYVSNNIGPGRQTNTADDWLAVTGPNSFRSDKPVFPLSNVKINPAEKVFELVLKNAGAKIPSRDPVDIRVIKSTREGTGKIIDSQKWVGGWPKYSRGRPVKDSDKDGMPDYWEKKRKLNFEDPTDGKKDRDSDGYTNIEEYLNSLIK